jgi:prephenate dehydrogenase
MHLVVHGVGLIGGSVAAAVKRRRPECRVTGIGRRSERLQAAQAAGLIDDWTHTLRETSVDDNAIVVVCLPVDLISCAVIEAAAATPDGVMITDAGSVKQSVQEAITSSGAASARFVGAHPIAGSEQSGFEYADSELFAGRPCVVTASPAGTAFEQRCQDFWRSLGARVSFMDCQEHDRILALTSHLPHVMAAVTTCCVEPPDLSFAGTGFCDSTRVASGDPELWQQILCSNRTQLLHAIRKAEAGLAEISTALVNGDRHAVAAILERAAQLRRAV